MDRFKKFKGEYPKHGQCIIGRYKDGSEHEMVTIKLGSVSWFQFKGQTGIIKDPKFIKILPEVKQMVSPNFY